MQLEASALQACSQVSGSNISWRQVYLVFELLALQLLPSLAQRMAQ